MYMWWFIPAKKVPVILIRMIKDRIFLILYDVAAVIMVLSLALLHTELKAYIPYIYGVAAAVFFVMQLRSQDYHNNLVVRRLLRQQALGGLLLMLAAVPLWMEVRQQWPFRHNEWIVVVAIGAWMQLYTAFRIPKELEKAKKEESK